MLIFRFYKAIEDNIVSDEIIGETQAKVVGNSLVALGSVFVLSSMYALGVTGTYLGDYCGILMEERVTSFPFNVLNNPMYVGSSLIFTGHSVSNRSPAGLLISAAVMAMYAVALKFEGPFTAKIYADAGR